MFLDKDTSLERPFYALKFTGFPICFVQKKYFAYCLFNSFSL